MTGLGHGGCEEHSDDREHGLKGGHNWSGGAVCELGSWAAMAKRKKSVLEAQKCSDGGFEIWFGFASRGTRLCMLVASELFCELGSWAASDIGLKAGNPTAEKKW
ncbi:hypothetical protein M0R45_021605 [Rubus argutus]|uniref:Uncharacterized protein n=1 Tax=Rubus argutus TaxID=59490 RepID=A0AAW1XE32_RUBAR